MEDTLGVTEDYEHLATEVAVAVNPAPYPCPLTGLEAENLAGIEVTIARHQGILPGDLRTIPAPMSPSQLGSSYIGLRARRE